MNKNRQISNSPTHFLVTLTGCVLLLASSAGAHPAITRGENLRPEQVLTPTISGEIQGTIRKIRHIVGHLFDKASPATATASFTGRFVLPPVASLSAYSLVYSHQVLHLRNREIRCWLLRV
jgi:hypothetical protein